MKSVFTQTFFVLTASVIAAIAAVFLPTAVTIILIVGIAAWLLSDRLIVGFYILLFLYPFLGWSIAFWNVPPLAGIPYVGGVNAPVADLWAVLLLVAFGVRLMRDWYACRPARVRAPGLFLYGVFVLSALLSLFSLRGFGVSGGVQFLIRNIIFFYVAYVILPCNVGMRAHHIKRGVWVLLSAGLIATLWGLSSLFVVEPFWGMWRRVTPFAIGGFAPLGYYHNDLAEVLVVMVPLAFWAYSTQKNALHRKLMFLYSTVLLLVTLLTFSRTAWIVLFVQAALFIAFSSEKTMKSLTRLAAPAAILVVPLAAYMVFFSASSYVSSSTSARIDLTRVALVSFQQRPLFGNGAGSFVGLVGSATAFGIEYGPAFDAHGVIQKLLAEQGIVGLTTFFIFIAWIIWYLYDAFVHTRDKEHKTLLLALFVIVVGAVVYQLFNTQYYTAKMWMPIGFAFAAARAFAGPKLLKL